MENENIIFGKTHYTTQTVSGAYYQSSHLWIEKPGEKEVRPYGLIFSLTCCAPAEKRVGVLGTHWFCHQCFICVGGNKH